MGAKDFMSKVLSKRPDTRIILTTAAQSIGPIATELGILCLIPKPIVPEDLGKLLNSSIVKKNIPSVS
jgi:hypothetical protein